MLITIFFSVFIASISGNEFHDSAEEIHIHVSSRQSGGEQKQVVFGPQNSDECPFNYELTSLRNIRQIRIDLEECTAEHIPCQSAKHSKYRNIDGTCNNLKHPTWGRSNNCLRRILPYDYGDNVSQPRKSCTGKDLPNFRLISDVFHRELVNHYDPPLTTMLMEWGQLIAHDISLNDVFRTPESDFNFIIDCCKNGPEVSDKCMTYKVPPTDSFYPKHGITCVGNARTVPCPNCRGGQRHHWNQNTAYLDASILYGSTDKRARELRSFKKGMMIVESHPTGPTLPTVAVQELCVSPPNQKGCYKAGDPRSNQNLFMLTIHTMLLRNHNNIAMELGKLNPHWKDEKLYQETRRIVIAQIQKVSYADYLPIIMGEIAKDMNFLVQPGASYTEYNPEIDAGVVDEFTNVAQRYGHSHVPPTFTEVDPRTGDNTTHHLRDSFYTPFGFRNGQFDRMCGGMIRDTKMKHDIFVNSDLRNYLYRRNYLNETTGLDLTGGAIIRGRDHGVPGYTSYVQYLRDITVTSFADLKTNRLMPDDIVDKLQKLYDSVHDLDLYTAALAEYQVPGGLVGRTFGRILGDQHYRSKFGDRYYFEHKNQAGSFTKDQLLEIKRTTVSRLVCDTTKITKIQANAFKLNSSSNPFVSCKEIHKFNFNPWKE